MDSSALVIAVVMFANLQNGSMKFGFTATDGDELFYFENGWDTLDAFQNEFPDAESLQEYVLEDVAYFDQVDFASVIVQFPGN